MSTASPPPGGPYPYAPPPGYAAAPPQATTVPVGQASAHPQQWGPQPGQFSQQGQVSQFGHAGQPGQFAQRKPGNGLAIAAIAMSTAALLGVLGFAALMFLAPGGSSWALSGAVAPSAGAVSSQVLEDELTTLLEDDNAVVKELTCPASSKVGQGETTVCRGDVDGAEWIGIVVFEGDSGEFVLTEY